MTLLRQRSRRQVDRFLSALFLPDELIELRLIESWISHGRKTSRVVHSTQWLRRDEFLSRHAEIASLARHERANVYFGVCPRPKQGDGCDKCIATVRCIWCDIDNVTVQDAIDRWDAAQIPQPSIVVNSGYGVHGYWLLDRDLTSREERFQLTAMMRVFYESFGGDHVQNVSRLMRLPGTLNYKDRRNGRRPSRCTLCTCKPDLRYPLDAFMPWVKQAHEEAQSRQAITVSRFTTDISPELAAATYAEARELATELTRPSRDRSRRDFAIVCELLRLGLTRDEIWSLVASCSKFESNGQPYFDVTVANAERTVGVDPCTAGRTAPSS